MRLRTLLLIPLGLLAVALLAAGGFTLYGQSQHREARERFSAQFGTPNLAALDVTTVADDCNAGEWLRRGAAGLDGIKKDREAIARLSATALDSWTEDDTAAARAMLTVREEGLAYLKRAAECPRGSFEIDYALGLEAPLPDYARLLRASQVLVVEARLALLSADLGRAATAISALTRAIDTTSADPLIVAVIVAHGLDRQFLVLAHDILAHRLHDPSLLSQLLRHVAARDLEATWRRGIQGEGAMIDAIRLDDRVRHGGATAASFLSAVSHAPFDRLFKAALLDEMAELGAAVDGSMAELRETIERRRAEPHFWNRHRIFTPSLGDTVSRFKGLESSYRLASAALRFALEGEAPEPHVDGFIDQPIAVELLPDGGLSISAPGAEPLWGKISFTPEHSNAPPFEWVVAGDSETG